MIEELLSLPVFVLCASIYIITTNVRLFVESILKLQDNKVWRNVVLPIIPLFLGGIICYLGFPVPTALDTTISEILFGSICGLFSGSIYKYGKGLLKIGDENEK